MPLGWWFGRLLKPDRGALRTETVGRGWWWWWWGSSPESHTKGTPQTDAVHSLPRHILPRSLRTRRLPGSVARLPVHRQRQSAYRCFLCRTRRCRDVEANGFKSGHYGQHWVSTSEPPPPPTPRLLCCCFPQLISSEARLHRSASPPTQVALSGLVLRSSVARKKKKGENFDASPHKRDFIGLAPLWL